MKKPFDKIKLSQLHILCNIIADSEVRDIGNIKRKYSERASAFDETLSFLIDLKILKNISNEFYSVKQFSHHNSIKDFKKNFLAALFSTNGNISETLRNFLFNFQTEKDKVFFKVTDFEKVKFSSIRNLLLELEFILASPDNTTYFINPDFSELFVNQFSRKSLTPESLKRKQTENELIGFTAEKAVIEYEIKRLTNISLDTNEIEHTSQKNVLSGYDIKSFENYLDNNSKRIYRYIEVKAVSVQDYKFYWSRNEMQIAKVFGEKYFLYLIPILSNDTFAFEKLKIIKNPIKEIYLNQNEWEKNEESMSFRKII